MERPLLTAAEKKRVAVQATLCFPGRTLSWDKTIFEKPGERVRVTSLENSSRDGTGLLMGGWALCAAEEITGQYHAMQSLWQTEASTTWPFGKGLGLISRHPRGYHVPFLSDLCSYCTDHIASRA